MKKSAMIFLVLVFLLVQEVSFPQTVILNPSFETIGNWTYSELDPNGVISGDYSSEWSTNGTWSYEFSTLFDGECTFYTGSGTYGEITQQVDFSQVDGLIFDVRTTGLSALGLGPTYWGAIQVFVNSDLVWSVTENYVVLENVFVDTSTYTGMQNLRIRRYFNESTCSTGPRPCYIDNLRTYSFTNPTCYPGLPDPILHVVGIEDYEANGEQWTRYLLYVENWLEFPDELFYPAPDLPPCGLNANSSRTWVDIYNGENSNYIYGFCALPSASDLNIMWFAVRRGDPPPETVYITIWDRRCALTYTSAPTLTLPEGCFSYLEYPSVSLVGLETYHSEGKDWTRYLLSVDNWFIYPQALFDSDPLLPPCGLNANSSRTWVDIYDADSDARLYGFCALGSPKQLLNLWFAVEAAEPPPSAVYITLTDRRCGDIFSSSPVPLILPPLEAPSVLIATPVSASQINLFWSDNSVQEEGYLIERRTDSTGIFSQIASVGRNVTGFSDRGLTAETLYHYRVRAYRAADRSSYSNEASAQTPSVTVPPATLRGLVYGQDSQGCSLGYLSGVIVSIPGLPPVTTGADGSFVITGIQPGAVEINASKSGYYDVTRNIDLQPNETRSITFALTRISTAGQPAGHNFLSSKGKKFIEGMPGTLPFGLTVAWNGTPGYVVFHLGTQTYNASLSNLGDGLSLASASIPAPQLVDTCIELLVEIANGEGYTTYLNVGVHFYPIPGIIIPWYRDNIPWTPSGLKLSYNVENTLTLWDLAASNHYKSRGFVGYEKSLSYDLLGGTFSGSLGGFGGYSQKLLFPDVDLLGNGKIELAGSLRISFAGCHPPIVTPSWTLGASGKAGLGAPAVHAIDIIFPPASPIIHSLLTVPVIRDVVGALRLRLFLLFGGELEGEYYGSQVSDGFLGTSSLSGSVTAGLEGQAVLEAFGAEVGVYAGGTGTPQFQLQPELRFDSLTLRAYVGVFAEIWFFKYENEIGAEIVFDNAQGASALRAISVLGDEQKWEPSGSQIEKWGEPYRPILSAKLGQKEEFLQRAVPFTVQEEKLMENVLKIANPVVIHSPTDTLVLYSHYDPQKPYYASTDIGYLKKSQLEMWSSGRLTDDMAAEFGPSAIASASRGAVLSWSRFSGDVSNATEPCEIAGNLEVIAARFDLAGATWTSLEQITNNNLFDRQPQPIRFGGIDGILWVQNEGDSIIGDSTSGDRLLLSQWMGSSWSSPAVLWSATKGILDFDFVSDGTGEGHIVFIIDEDGIASTHNDREVYSVSTVGGIWGTPERLTNDNREDRRPILVTLIESPCLIWSSSGIIQWSALTEFAAQELFSASDEYRGTYVSAGTALPGGAAIAYTVQTASGVDLFASFFDVASGSWCPSRRLTMDPAVESALTMDASGTEVVIGYLKTETIRAATDIIIGATTYHLEGIPQPGRTDLYLTTYSPAIDLAVSPENILFSTSNPSPSDVVAVTARIHNIGDFYVCNIPVVFYDGDPDLGGTIIGATKTIYGPIMPGATDEIALTWLIPEVTESHQVFVEIDPAGILHDRNSSNNVAFTWTVLPDLIVETFYSEQIGEATQVLIASLSNQGSVPVNNLEVEIRTHSLDGATLGHITVDEIPAYSSVDVTFPWNITEQEPGTRIQVFLRVDPSNYVVEFNEENNFGFVGVEIPLFPLKVEEWEIY